MMPYALIAAGCGLLALPGRAAIRRLPRMRRRATRFAALRLPVMAAFAGGAIAFLLGGVVAGALAAVVGACAVHVVRRRSALRGEAVAPLRLAASWDLLSACLRSGLGVPQAITIVAAELPHGPATALRATADLLALGAPAEQAWRPVLALPATESLGAAAVRSAHSGAALAELTASLAERLRAEAGDAADAAAQQAGVLVSGPLGCCFLPAFLCLGVVPVVIGLAGGMLAGQP